MLLMGKIADSSWKSFVMYIFKNDLNPTNLQVQLEQFVNLFQDKPNCSSNWHTSGGFVNIW